MPDYNYNIVTCVVSTDFGSHVRCADIPVKIDCSRETLMPHFGGCLCGDEAPYCQPLEFGDTMYFQFLCNNKAFSEIDIVDEDGNVLIANAALTYTFETFSVDENQYCNISIPFNLQFDGIDCFHVRFKFGDIIDPDPVNDFFITSNGYCRVSCNEKTIVIRSNHSIDCYGLAYPASNAQGFGFNNSYRIYGVLEPASFAFDSRQFNEDEELVSQNFVQNFLLRSTRPVPQYVADIIGLIISGRQVIIDGDTYTVRSGFTKNNPNGGEWVISIPVYKTCELDSLSCL